MAKLFYVRAAGALALCSLAFLLASFDPFLSAAPVGLSASRHGSSISVNRFRKGDRLPVHTSGTVWREQRAPDALQTQQKVPLGCDPAFSPVTAPALSRLYGRCMA